MNEETRTERDVQEWRKWLKDYCERIRHDSGGQSNIDNQMMSRRVELMNKSNPKFVLRNHILQSAIEQAEKGNFDQVRQILKLVEHPFDEAKGPACELSSYYSIGKQKVKVSCSS